MMLWDLLLGCTQTVKGPCWTMQSCYVHNQTSSAHLASPKSASFRCPSLVIRRLSGLMSLQMDTNNAMFLCHKHALLPLRGQRQQLHQLSSITEHHNRQVWCCQQRQLQDPQSILQHFSEHTCLMMMHRFVCAHLWTA